MYACGTNGIGYGVPSCISLIGVLSIFSTTAAVSRVAANFIEPPASAADALKSIIGRVEIRRNGPRCTTEQKSLAKASADGIAETASSSAARCRRPRPRKHQAAGKLRLRASKRQQRAGREC
jgi:hypothetical protein